MQWGSGIGPEWHSPERYCGGAGPHPTSRAKIVGGALLHPKALKRLLMRKEKKPGPVVGDDEIGVYND